MADIRALFAKELAVANTIAGCLRFQLFMDEASMAAKTAILSETYATAADHLAMNKALMAAGLVEGPDGVFATYHFVDMTFALTQQELDTPGYTDLLDQFKQVCPKQTRITHNMRGKGYGPKMAIAPTAADMKAAKLLYVRLAADYTKCAQPRMQARISSPYCRRAHMQACEKRNRTAGTPTSRTWRT